MKRIAGTISVGLFRRCVLFIYGYAFGTETRSNLTRGSVSGSNIRRPSVSSGTRRRRFCPPGNTQPGQFSGSDDSNGTFHFSGLSVQINAGPRSADRHRATEVMISRSSSRIRAAMASISAGVRSKSWLSKFWRRRSLRTLLGITESDGSPRGKPRPLRESYCRCDDRSNRRADTWSAPQDTLETPAAVR